MSLRFAQSRLATSRSHSLGCAYPSGILRSTKCASLATVARKPRAEGTIASVFASLSGEEAVALPDRFRTLKREILNSAELQQKVAASWVDLISHLRDATRHIIEQGSEVIPEVQFAEIKSGLSRAKKEEIQERGVVIVRNVVAEPQALKWLESIQKYITLNPDVKGYPEEQKAVYELYWSTAQIEARSHPNSLDVQRALLGLFNKKSTDDRLTSFSTPLTYCDRLRIRQPGDAKFALGPHCDGGSVERWEDPTYRRSYRAILEGHWRDHDAWDMAGRPEANMNMYEGPGACGVFRALQGWTSLSHTGKGEGTLKIYPGIRESSAYILLRPFFTPTLKPNEPGYLDGANWKLNLDSSDFPNSPLGRSQELNEDTHPHLNLPRTMTSLKAVHPGDQAWWHCDGVHSVEASNRGKTASSVMYIPSVPLTEANVHYIKEQRDCFLAGKPPPDFPGGVGEANFEGKGGYSDTLTEEGRRAMGLTPFEFSSASDEGERLLLQRANEILGF